MDGTMRAGGAAVEQRRREAEHAAARSMSPTQRAARSAPGGALPRRPRPGPRRRAHRPARSLMRHTANRLDAPTAPLPTRARHVNPSETSAPDRTVQPHGWCPPRTVTGDASDDQTDTTTWPCSLTAHEVRTKM